jgi:hypothetical protein
MSMKKNVLIIFLLLIGINNTVIAAACTVTSGVTTFPTGTSCKAEPDFFQLKVYDMMLCSAAPTAPTTAAAMVLTNCQSVLTSSGGSNVSVTNGGSSTISGTITRPDNGTYTHGYIRISSDFVVGDSRQYNTSLDEDSDGDADGVYCATTASGVDCDSSAVTAVNQTMGMGSTQFGSDYLIEDEVVTGGLVDAWLVDTNQKLEADTDGDVTYLVGVQAFTTPLVVSDSTTSMNTAFAVTTGMTIIHGGGNPPILSLTNGPFSVIMTIN